MANRASNYWKVIGVAGALAGLVAWPGTGRAQSSSSTLTGQASVATASVLGNVTSLVDTGTLTDPSEPLGAGLPLGASPACSLPSPCTPPRWGGPIRLLPKPR